MMKINGKTNLYFLIGKSIDYTLSPFIHNYLFKKFKINAVYIPINLQSNLETFLNSLNFFSNFKGANITIPYKEEAAKILNSKIDIINCIIKKKNKFIGLNTDIFGIKKTIQDDLKLKLENKNIAIFGAGATTKSFLYAIKNEKFNEVLIISRDKKKFNKLKKNFTKISWEKFSEKYLNLEKFDLIVNTTPLGINNENLPIDFTKLSDKNKIFEVNYFDTPLIKKAKNYNIQATNGLNMLIYQAVESFKNWTNIEIDKKTFNYLKKILKN